MRLEARSRSVVRRGVSRFEAVVVAVVCGLLIALLVPAALQAREAARRTACRANLHQIGGAIHAFHGVHNGLPPSSLGPRKIAFFGLLLPYCDAGRALASFYFNEDVADGGRNQELAESDAACALDVFHCPSRRRGVQRSVAATDRGQVGPTSDYALVVWYDKDGEPASTDVEPDELAGWQTWHDPAEVGRHHGPFRVAQIRNGDYSIFYPRDTFDALTDGTSYTAFVAEKHVRPWELNRCCGGDDAAREGNDGSVLAGEGDWRDVSAARSARLPIARSATDFLITPAGAAAARSFSFGSWHPGAIHFLLGDGSVRDVSSSTPSGAPDTPIWRLGHARDGHEFAWE